MKQFFYSILICTFAFQTAFTQDAATRIVNGALKGEVSVRRDARGIPYIAATNEADLYFVQGYITARDRLWQMDNLRRVARGELAEIFGRSVLEQDKRWRRFGFAKVADDSFRSLSPQMQSVLEAYAKGVNAYIDSLSEAELPDEFKLLKYRPREWRPADSLVIGKILADALSTTYQRDLMRESLKGFDPKKLADITDPITPYDVILFGKDSPVRSADASVGSAYKPTPHSEKPSQPNFCGNHDLSLENDLALRAESLRFAGLYSEDLAASNNWVISGKRTADGKPILANDPHLAPSVPGIWYIVHLSNNGNRVAGVTFPGTPGVVLGHNDHIAWGATNVGPDVQDLFVETFEGTKYKTPNGMADAEIREEKIGFRASPLDPALTYETHKIVTTRNGPVILERDGKQYSLKWTALDPKNNEFEAFYHINKATNWDQFKTALKGYGGATQNFVYADVKGNIGWYAAGRIPIRRTGEGAFPYDGVTNDGDWVGFIPFEDLPNLYNPPEGFIITANQRIVGTSYRYPQLSRDAASPWRARRLHDLISRNAKATIDDSRDAQTDVFNIPLKMFADDLVAMKMLNAGNTELLSKWDGNMYADSKAALVVNRLRNCVADRIAESNAPVISALIRERILFWAIKEKPARWLPSSYKSYNDLVEKCEASVFSSLSQLYGEDQSKWIWAVESRSRFAHPLQAAPLIGQAFAATSASLNGSGQTPNVASYVSMRHIASPGNWDATRLVIPLGQSGRPRSSHYGDQFNDWRDNKIPVFPFSRSAVEEASKLTMTFGAR